MRINNPNGVLEKIYVRQQPEEVKQDLPVANKESPFKPLTIDVSKAVTELESKDEVKTPETACESPLKSEFCSKIEENK